MALPAWPQASRLIEFPVSEATTFRFFIDADSLSTGSDGVVRYTLVARSPAGVDNVTYEGIRCATGIYKIFAFGNDGRWTPSRSEWKEIIPKTAQRWHQALRRQFFCPQNLAIHSAAEGLDALRRGAHPSIGRDRF